MENKRVKLINCESKLQFIKAIKDVTARSLVESKNIADLIINSKYDLNCKWVGYEYGTLLLNESSITPEEWEKIVSLCNVKFEYV